MTPRRAPSEYTTPVPRRRTPRLPAYQLLTGHANGTGRRKEAMRARVRIVPGTGEWKINGRSLDSYFPNKVHQQIVAEPFVTLGAEGNFDVIARIVGGGVSPAGALRLGVARALILVDPEFRPALKKAGFLTRDARVSSGRSTASRRPARPLSTPSASRRWYPNRPTWADSLVLTVCVGSLG